MMVLSQVKLEVYMFIRTESFREFIRYYPVVSSIIAIQIILYLLTELPILPKCTIIRKIIRNQFIHLGWRMVATHYTDIYA